MQSIIQTAIDAGQIFDANGNKISDISQLGLTFGSDMTDGLAAVNNAIGNVTTGLQTGLAGGFSQATADAQKLTDLLTKLPTNSTFTEHIVVDGSVPGGAATGAAMGGLVTSTGVDQYLAGGGPVWSPRGSDTVRAMLTPGERVLSVPENRAYMAGGSSVAAFHAAIAPMHADIRGLRNDLVNLIQAQPLLMRHALRGAR